MKFRLLTLFAGCLGLALGGCASHSTLVVARCGPQPLPATARKVAFMKSAQPRPEDETLKHAVVAELESRGFQIVPQVEADLTLNCAVEDSWRNYSAPASPPTVFQSAPPPMVVTPGSAVYVERWRLDPLSAPADTEEHIATQGIRLLFYRSESLSEGRFETAWEGYIEAGLRLRENREPLLLKTLFGYFGRDYSGRAKLAE